MKSLSTVSPLAFPTSQPVSKVKLSAPRRQLLERMWKLHFGWIEQLQIKDGEPVLPLTLKSIQEIKLQGEPFIPRPDQQGLLREPHRELFAYFDRVQNGTIEKLIIKYGMPFKVEAVV